MKLFVIHLDVEHGPLSREEVFTALRDGVLTGEDFARWEGDREWQPLEEILKSGMPALFSVEEIIQLQENLQSQTLPPVPPEAQASEPLPELPEQPPRSRRTVLMMSACLALVLLTGTGSYLLFKPGVSGPSRNEASVTPQGEPFVSNFPTELVDANKISTPVPASAASASQVVPVPTNVPVENKVVHPTPIAIATNPAAGVAGSPPSVVATTAVTPITSGPSPSPAQSSILNNPPSALPQPPVVNALARQQETKPPDKNALQTPVFAPTPAAVVMTTPAPSPQFQTGVVMGGFFSIKKLEFREKSTKANYGTWSSSKDGKETGQYVPSLMAQVETRETIRKETLYARAYFYDEKGSLLATVAAPDAAMRGARSVYYSMPVLFEKQKPEPLFFCVPKKLKGQKWKAVVVFGDSHEAVAMGYPGGTVAGVDYPEKNIVEGRAGGLVKRKPDLDPLLEYAVKTSNPRQPKITLLLRAPDGVSDPGQVQGVMAMCLLGNSINNVKRQLQQVEVGDDVRNMIGFANKHKLAILCWSTGATLWNAGANYDELSKKENQKFDKEFDEVADGWERGVKELQKKYGLPDHNYLLVGICASAQWAHRLAMRKPQYFLAAYLHIPSSFDTPTPEASRLLWLLTAGELDGGYVHSTHFYQDCHKMGYPMIFKPIMLLGHSGSPVANNLAVKFFEYALSVKDEREAYDKERKDALAQLKKKDAASGTGPWLESFRRPEFYGDYLNQECYPARQSDMIPAALRVPLPTKELADAWNK